MLNEKRKHTNAIKLSNGQYEELKMLAKRYGISQQQIIERGIELYKKVLLDSDHRGRIS